MAGATLKLVHRYDDRQMAAALDRLADAALNMRTVFADIGEHLKLSHYDRFQAQEAPDGTPWQPLDPKYQARKKKNQDLILILDEYLQDTQDYNAADDGLEYGSNRIYAATHQFGAPDRGIPERPWLGLSDDDEAEILHIVNRYLSDAIKS